MKMKLIYTLIMVIIVTSGCASKIQIKVLEPAEVKGVANTKIIAVTNFKKDYNVGLAGKIETEILKQVINKKPYFTVVDRTTINNVINEQRFQSSGLLNEETSVEIGKILGAQALISGEITSASSSDTHYRESRVRFYNPLRPLQTSYVTYINCIKRLISLGVNLKIVDVKRANIIYADNIMKDDVYKHCNDDSHFLPSKQQGIERLANEIAKIFVAKIAPQYKNIDVVLLDSIEFDTSSKQANNFELALNWIKESRYDKALAILEKLNISLQGKSYVVLYNLGVIAEAENRLEDAKNLYNEADALITKPVEEIDEAKTRIVQTIKKHQLAMKQISK